MKIIVEKKYVTFFFFFYKKKSPSRKKMVINIFQKLPTFASNLPTGIDGEEVTHPHIPTKVGPDCNVFVWRKLKVHNSITNVCL